MRTDVRPGGVVPTVENTGEKISPEQASALTEPFRRGAERVHTDHGGVGLVLTIVRTIAQAHDGRSPSPLAPRPAGGLRVTVELPGV